MTDGSISRDPAESLRYVQAKEAVQQKRDLFAAAQAAFATDKEISGSLQWLETHRRAIMNVANDASPLPHMREDNGNRWGFEAGRLFKLDKEIGDYFTMKRYGSALKALAEDKGEVKENTQRILDEGKNMGLMLEEFFQTAIPEYKEFRENPRELSQEEKGTNLDFTLQAMEKGLSALRIYHHQKLGEIQQKPSPTVALARSALPANVIEPPTQWGRNS